jgi:hypothetical protein
MPDIVTEAVDILKSVIRKIASKNNVKQQDANIFFLLKSPIQCKYRYKDNDVDISIAGWKAAMFKGKIDSFVTGSLIRLSKEYNLPQSFVNVLATIDDGNDLKLTLRNGSSIVKELSIKDIVN